LRTRQYVTKTGDQRYTTEVIIDEVLFLDKVKDGAPK
jgi:single-stranded DNA-binding protein